MLVFAYMRNDRHRAAYFMLLAGALMFYSLGYLLELMAQTPGEQMLALRVENIAIPLVAPFFLLTTLGFFQERTIRPWMMRVSVAYGAVMYITIFLNDLHLLYYSSITMVHNGLFYVLKLGKGPLYFVQQGVSLSCMLVAYAILAIRFLHGSQKLRSQMGLYIIGSLFGFVANFANLTGIVPLGIDPTPLALTLGLIFFAIDLQQHKLLDIVPAAFNMAIEYMDDAVVVLDSEWGFIYCNQKAKRLIPALRKFSGTEEIIRAQGWPEAVIPQADSEVTFAMADVETGKETLQRANVNAIHNAYGKTIGVSVIIRDVTKITAMLNRLEEMATTDPLTGVYNRRHFMTLIEQQMAMAKRYGLHTGILLMDIDHFKKVNDEYGHLAGDHVLCEIVNMIVRQLRKNDVIARYGGEEFVIFSVEKDVTGLLSFAERLRKTIENTPIMFENEKIAVTASFGATLAAPGHSYDAAMAVVDKALYEAKNHGRNRVEIGEIEP